MMHETVTFRLQVNDGPPRDFTVNTGIYIAAVAAAPAVLGLEDYPMDFRIWVEGLQPDYPPLRYRIEEPGGAVRLLVSRAQPLDMLENIA